MTPAARSEDQGNATAPPGNDRLLFGMILGVVAFWLFAQTTLNIASTMATDLGIEMSVMNIAVSITALFSGIFVVIVGGLADRIGRVKIVQIGFVFGIVGALLVGLAPSGGLATPALMIGRICQGLSAACIMPASLALVKAYWEGPGRQRAVSMWSMGSWGGSGFAALFGGLVAQNVGWRWIFVACAGVSIIGMLMVRGTPESKVASKGRYEADVKGIATFMVAMIALQLFVTQGGVLGWLSPASVALLAIAIVVGAVFVRVESGNPKAFVDFRLFRNRTYTGATLSNLLLNAVAGIIIVAMTLVQVGGGLSAQEAGLLTLGYGIGIVAFIRVGEKLLQRFGARKPMIWGCLIVAAAILLLIPTNVLLGTYRILVIAAFSLFGIGLAFYATPSTDAALANLPDDQSGAGSGIYKMASSLGASFGVAISAAIFTALSADESGLNWLPGVLTFVGRQDNVALREAAVFAFAANLLMIVAALVAIVLLVPKGKPGGASPSRRPASADGLPGPDPAT